MGPDPRDSADLEALRSLTITAILSLQTKDDLRDRGVGWEEKAARAAGLDFLNMPVTDFDSADLQHKLPECVKALDGMLKAGHSVYVHCTAGVSRSPTVVVAYLHWCLAWPLAQALAHVKRFATAAPIRRPSATPTGRSELIPGFATVYSPAVHPCPAPGIACMIKTAGLTMGLPWQ